MAFDKVRYDYEYGRAHYDVIKATIPKGKASSVKAEAAARGISVSQLIIDALENCYGLDLGK